jgi:ElaB/YqjD/DUF883 family membrane-anchored ribosome-binding protein
MSVTHADPDLGSEADTLEQIRELREQVDMLVRDRVKPILADAVDRAEDAARQATGFVREEAEIVAKQVREKPLTALLIAAAAGYVLGRILR